MCMCVLPTRVQVQPMHVVPEEAREGIGSPGTGAADGYVLTAWKQPGFSVLSRDNLPAECPHSYSELVMGVPGQFCLGLPVSWSSLE